MPRPKTEIATIEVHVPLGHNTFKFALCEKPLVLTPELTLRQFWMDKKRLDKPFGSDGGNFQAIVDSFWNVCEQHGLCSDPDNQQAYLQARLLPTIRPIGASNVLWDASFSNKMDLRSRIGALEATLRSPAKRREEACDPRVRFREETANALQLPTETTPETEAYYWEFDQQMFKDVAGIVETDPAGAFALVKQRWTRWVNGIGRRNNKAQKLALDYISFECKAAFYRCYSVAWCLLIDQLVKEVGLTPLEAKFHSFWHLQSIEHSNRRDASFARFHGHVFALHPALSDLIQTPTGRNLLARYLLAPGEEHDRPETEQLMDAIAIATYHYFQVAEEIRENRRVSGKRAAGEREELIFENRSRAAYRKAQDELMHRFDSNN